jgi:hypothetical protein
MSYAFDMLFAVIMLPQPPFEEEIVLLATVQKIEHKVHLCNNEYTKAV